MWKSPEKQKKKAKIVNLLAEKYKKKHVLCLFGVRIFPFVHAPSLSNKVFSNFSSRPKFLSIFFPGIFGIHLHNEIIPGDNFSVFFSRQLKIRGAFERCMWASFFICMCFLLCFVSICFFCFLVAFFECVAFLQFAHGNFFPSICKTFLFHEYFVDFQMPNHERSFLKAAGFPLFPHFFWGWGISTELSMWDSWCSKRCLLIRYGRAWPRWFPMAEWLNNFWVSEMVFLLSPLFWWLPPGIFIIYGKSMSGKLSEIVSNAWREFQQFPKCPTNWSCPSSSNNYCI